MPIEQTTKHYNAERAKIPNYRKNAVLFLFFFLLVSLEFAFIFPYFPHAFY